jgi:hypothetical protein
MTATTKRRKKETREMMLACQETEGDDATVGMARWPTSRRSQEQLCQCRTWHGEACCEGYVEKCCLGIGAASHELRQQEMKKLMKRRKTEKIDSI